MTEVSNKLCHTVWQSGSIGEESNYRHVKYIQMKSRDMTELRHMRYDILTLILHLIDSLFAIRAYDEIVVLGTMRSKSVDSGLH